MAICPFFSGFCRTAFSLARAFGEHFAQAVAGFVAFLITWRDPLDFLGRLPRALDPVEPTRPQVRAFHARRLQRDPDRRARAPLSTAFAAAA